MNVYFDNAASTIVRDEALSAMLRVMQDNYGNPSSVHYMGRRAADELEHARKNVADALGAGPDTIYFTSGGTESCNWAVLGAAESLKRKGRHILTSAIEHDSVLESAKKLKLLGWEVTLLAPDNEGRIPPESFAAALREDTVLASVMLVNNETGVINPINEYSSEIKRRSPGTLLHTDAVQGFCKIPFKVSTLGADLITVSAHKIHGPKGVGALYIRPGVKMPPALLGGGHEKGLRSGTEALQAIAGFGEAARLGQLELDENALSAQKLREYLIQRLQSELHEVVIIGSGGSPFLLGMSLPGHRSEVLMNFLDGEGICVSKSSACKKGARSRVLEAMRLKNEIIDGALRVSFSRYSTLDEAECFVQALKRASETLHKAP